MREGIKLTCMLLVSIGICISCNNGGGQKNDATENDVEEQVPETIVLDKSQVIEVIKEYLKGRQDYQKVEEEYDKYGQWNMTYYEEYDEQDFMNNLCESIIIHEESIIIDDFNNDKYDDAIINITSCSCPMGNSCGSYYYLLKGSMESFNVGPCLESEEACVYQLDLTKYSDGVFYGVKRVMQSADQCCCPSKKIQVRFVYVDDKFQELK
jgi:hypothetical protein